MRDNSRAKCGIPLERPDRLNCSLGCRSRWIPDLSHLRRPSRCSDYWKPHPRSASRHQRCILNAALLLPRVDTWLAVRESADRCATSCILMPSTPGHNELVQPNLYSFARSSLPCLNAKTFRHHWRQHQFITNTVGWLYRLVKTSEATQRPKTVMESSECHTHS